MSDEMFTADQPTEGASSEAPAATTPEFELTPEVQELIGEGKKYSDLGSAIKSIAPAQGHISKLEEENAKLRAQVEQANKLEAVLEKLNGKKEDTSTQTEAPAIDINAIAEHVEASMKQRDQVNQQQANVGSVKAKLEEVYGDDAKGKYAQRASELGMSTSALTALAAQSPEAALTLIGVPKVEEGSVKSGSEINPAALDVGRESTQKTVMWGSTTKEAIDVWRDSAPKP